MEPKWAMRQQPSLGEQGEQSHVFLVRQEVARTELDRELSATCAVEEACFNQPRLGAGGTAR